MRLELNNFHITSTNFTTTGATYFFMHCDFAPYRDLEIRSSEQNVAFFVCVLAFSVLRKRPKKVVNCHFNSFLRSMAVRTFMNQIFNGSINLHIVDNVENTILQVSGRFFF